ncbi:MULTISPECIES: ornithine cyclodeaminase family protein [unclassified Pseudomonas]|uniref:ornithine cyclodeaminase family protein n=1 Tax=unclassified Pseudomonas TaxID=196821 RepID=UPI0039B76D91
MISAQQIQSVLDWEGVLQALHEAHLGSRPLGDSYFIGDADYGLFSRGVILPGVGAGIKLASIFPANAKCAPPLPTEHAAFVVIDQTTKAIAAILNGPAITSIKTAADSTLAACRLSREDSEVLLVLGAGPVARALTDAYLHIRPSIRQVLLWNRSPEKLQDARIDLQNRGFAAFIVQDLNEAVARADIISSATSSSTPIILGCHVRPGTHVDLVGSFRPDMREADSALLGKGRIFVDDSQSAAVAGDILIPLKEGAISDAQIEGDLFDLCQLTDFERRTKEITVYKNAGGGHLDLIVSLFVMRRLNELQLD